MKVFVALEGHFVKYRGVYYTTTTFKYEFFKRYLDVFDSVVVVARVRKVDELDTSLPCTSGPRLSFYELPDYRGPYSFAIKFQVIRKKLRKVSFDRGAFILRVPGVIGSILGGYLIRQGKPYGLEVVGDPEDVLSPEAVGYPFVSPFARRFEVNSFKKLTEYAPAVSYVTENTLQVKYPPRDGFVTWYSSVELPDEIFDIPINFDRFDEGEKTIIFVGSLNHFVKGLDVLLKALSVLIRRGCRLRLKVLGDGVRRGVFEKLRDELGLGESVEFLGYVEAGWPVFRELMRAHIFVLPSLQEGLPRSLIEAMAAGLPAIATRVGGIPELLEDEYLVEKGDVIGLANKIEELINSPVLMRELAMRNREKAKKYKSSLLSERRRQFYSYVKSLYNGRLR